MADEARCAWCGRREEDPERIRVRVPDRTTASLQWVELPVHARHERRLRRFLARFRAEGPRFLSLLGVAGGGLMLALIVVVAAAGGTAAGEALGTVAVGAFLVFLGGLLFRCPFATPLTTRLLGLRGSILLLRAVAAALIAGSLGWMVGTFV